MNSLDTNVVLRFILGDVPDQTLRAQNLITASACYVTDVVVAETVFVLEKFYDLPRHEIVFGIKKFLALPNIIYNSEVIDEAIGMFEITSKLSIVDCYSSVEAEKSDAMLNTFDKELIKIGGKHVLEP